jgi:hypothetical protein
MLVQLTQIELDGDLEQDFNKLRMTLGEKSWDRRSTSKQVSQTTTTSEFP